VRNSIIQRQLEERPKEHIFMFKNKLGTIAPLAFVGLSLVVMPLAGADDKKDEKKATEKKSTAAPAPAKPAGNLQPGMVVVKDPVTGQLRAPTADEFAALAAAAGPAQNNATTGSRAITGPGGGAGLVLDGSSDVFTVATRNADGTITFGEAVGPAAAKAAVTETRKPLAKGVANNEK
jgi:hypothetical protein